MGNWSETLNKLLIACIPCMIGVIVPAFLSSKSVWERNIFRKQLKNLDIFQALLLWEIFISGIWQIITIILTPYSNSLPIANSIMPKEYYWLCGLGCIFVLLPSLVIVAKHREKIIVKIEYKILIAVSSVFLHVFYCMHVITVVIEKNYAYLILLLLMILLQASIIVRMEDRSGIMYKVYVDGIENPYISILPPKHIKKLDKDNQKQKTNQGNEYQCARKEVDNFTQGNRDRLLQLKSEAQKIGFSDEYSRKISWAAMIICVLTLFYMIVAEVEQAKIEQYAIFILLMLVFLLPAFGLPGKDYTCIKRWRTYIMTAIEECDRELLDRSQNQTVSCNSSDAPNSPQNDIVDKNLVEDKKTPQMTN